MRTSLRSMPMAVITSARWPMFLSLVRPERISSPITIIAAVMMSAMACPFTRGPQAIAPPAPGGNGEGARRSAGHAARAKSSPDRRPAPAKTGSRAAGSCSKVAAAEIPGVPPAMLSVVTGLVAAALAAVLLVSTYFVWLTRRIARDAEHAVPPRGRFVTVEGCDIHYVERGEGRPILMIHGLGGTLHHMRRPLMEEFGDGYRLIALDRPGSGYSTRPAGF